MSPQACPLCQGQEFNVVHECVDYTASNSVFHISSCGVCGFLVTRPQPAQDEIMSFYPDADYISHSSTAVTLTDYLFKIARAFTLRWKQTIISAHSQKGTLLDVGCGTGDFLFACKKSGWQITGVEPSMKAQKLAAQKTASHIHTKLEEVSGHEFNVITLWHVLEHLHDPNGTIQKLKTLLAQNGILVIALPNYESFDANKYNAYWAGFDVPRHLWHFSSSNFNKLAKNNGLNVVTTIPMKLDSYYVSLLSEKNKRGKNTLTGYINALITGFRSNWLASKSNNFSSLIYVVKP